MDLCRESPSRLRYGRHPHRLGHRRAAGIVVAGNRIVAVVAHDGLFQPGKGVSGQEVAFVAAQGDPPVEAVAQQVGNGL